MGASRIRGLASKDAIRKFRDSRLKFSSRVMGEKLSLGEKIANSGGRLTMDVTSLDSESMSPRISGVTYFRSRPAYVDRIRETSLRGEERSCNIDTAKNIAALANFFLPREKIFSL